MHTIPQQYTRNRLSLTIIPFLFLTITVGTPVFSQSQLSKYISQPKSELLHPYVYKYDSARTPEEGYYFLSQETQSNADTLRNFISIFDTRGRRVYFQKTNMFTKAEKAKELTVEFRYKPGIGFFYLHGYKTPGTLLRSVLYIMNNSFEIIDSITCQDGLKLDGHDIHFNSEGEALLMCVEEKMMDVRSIDTARQKRVEGLAIQVLDSEKKLRFTWSSFDHLALSDAYDEYLKSEYNPSFIDWIHPNSITEDGSGNILFSAKHFNQLILVSRSTGKVLWRLGGKNNSFRFTNDDGFTFQHSCSVLPNGNITLFDNGFYNKKPYSRAVEYQLDTVNMTATKVWEYNRGKKYISDGKGSIQRLKENNSLISWGQIKLKGPEMTMVDSAGNILAELNLTDFTETYSAYYINPPFEIERPRLAMVKENGTTYLTVSGEYEKYLWNTGATSSRIEVDQPGEYFVFINKGAGMLSSEYLMVQKSDL